MAEKMNNKDIGIVVKILEEESAQYVTPIVTQYAERKRTPFQILVSTVLSARTKDETTAEASSRLFSSVNTPADIIALGEKKIAGLIYPVGFYNLKAKNLIELSQSLIDNYGGAVPDTIEELLKLKGVGRKTANLVVNLGFNKPGICVDTHVHRITNRWGYVKTATPEKTEMALREKLPLKYWIPINTLLVTYGQNLCKPISPICSRCRIAPYCDKANVEKSR